MKKLPFISTLIAGALLNIASPLATHATIKYDDTTWYTIPEMLEYKDYAETEISNLCGDDSFCKENYYFQKIETDDRFRSLDSFLGGRFWTTSINPAEETLEAIYFDEDPMLKMWGIEEHQHLDHVFMAWFDKDNFEVGNYNHEFPVEPQFSEEVHLMFADYGENHFEGGFPSNQVFKLDILPSGLKNNHTGHVSLATYGRNYNSKGYFDYSSCLNNPYYELGQSCELVFAEDGWYTYLPSGVVIQSDDKDDSGEPDRSAPEELLPYLDQILAGEDIDIEGIINGSTDTSNESEESNETKETLGEPEQTLPKTPNTGDYTRGCEKIVEFPWWLGLLLLIGNSAVLWLFFPKKSKKTLDKKSDI